MNEPDKVKAELTNYIALYHMALENVNDLKKRLAELTIPYEKLEKEYELEGGSTIGEFTIRDKEKYEKHWYGEPLKHRGATELWLRSYRQQKINTSMQDVADGFETPRRTISLHVKNLHRIKLLKHPLDGTWDETVYQTSEEQKG